MSAQPTDEDYATLAAFRHTLRAFAAFSEAEAKAAGLSPQQHQALLAIRGKAGQAATTVGELAAHLLIRHHSAVELVDRMAEAGLVRRRTDPLDKRRILVTLTPLAERLLRRLSAVHLEELRTIRPGLLRLLEAL